MQAQHLNSARLEVFFRLIKTRRALEAWARNQGEAAFRQLRSYPLAATSGTLGPKRRAGDGQVPEGFYTIDRFNPSRAATIDYPTPDDVLATGLADPGIDEVYLLAVAARAAGQASISVHLFPFPVVESELRPRAASPHAAF